MKRYFVRHFCSCAIRDLTVLGFVLASAGPLLGQSAALAQEHAARAQLEAESKDSKKDFSFVRLVKAADGTPTSLDVASVRYTRENSDDGVRVDLVGAVHVGDASYYGNLNRRFRRYDAVLYELVAPEGARVPKGGGHDRGLLSMIQGGMKDVMGLTFQLEQIDYTRKNFVHADMSPDEFAASMRRRGESKWSMIAKVFKHGMTQKAKKPTNDSELKMMAAIFSANREHDLKIAMAEQFADMDESIAVFGGADGSTIVTERNKKALSVLERELAAGRKKIAIFYGAAHLEDMEDRLIRDFGMKRESVEWIQAWDLTEENVPQK